MSQELLCSCLKRRYGDGSRWLSVAQRWSIHLAKLQLPTVHMCVCACVCVYVCISMRVCQRLTLITRIVPLVFAMTVIVIAAAFGSSANRSVMSSQATTEADRFFRNGHHKVFSMTQRWVEKETHNCSLMFSFSYLRWKFICEEKVKEAKGFQRSQKQRAVQKGIYSRSNDKLGLDRVYNLKMNHQNKTLLNSHFTLASFEFRGPFHTASFTGC